MTGQKNIKAARGTTIVRDAGPPMRGEPELNMNKQAPSKIGGGPRDLSATLGGATIPGGQKGD